MSNSIFVSSLRDRPAQAALRRLLRRNRPRVRALGLALLWVVLATASPVTAQDAKIFEQEPFDTITLNEANQNRVLQTLPLNLPAQGPRQPRSELHAPLAAAEQSR